LEIFFFGMNYASDPQVGLAATGAEVEPEWPCAPTRQPKTRPTPKTNPKPDQRLTAMKHQLIPIFGAAALFAVASSVQALTIDTFDDTAKYFFGPPGSGPDGSALAVNASFPTESRPQTGVATAIGGQRTTTAQFTSGGGVLNIANRNEPLVNSGVMDVAVGSGTNGTATILWDNVGGIDLKTAGGTAEGFFLALPTAIDNTLTVTINVEDGTDTSTDSRNFANGAFGADFFFAFSNFTNQSVLDAATSIEIVLSSDQDAWDAQIDLFETRPRPPSDVPVPGTLVLLGLGLAGLGARCRKQA
jgi:hypothetical protein